MKKAKSRLPKNKTLLRVTITSGIIVTWLWVAVFYLLSQPQVFAKQITVEKTITKEVEKEEEYIPSARTLKIIENNPTVAGAINRKFGKNWRRWAELIARESSFNPSILNPTSGACGLAQALPCSKMECSLDMEGIDCQLDWIEEYVGRRYGTIEYTLTFHDIKNWY